jgi:hypothetical protein
MVLGGYVSHGAGWIQFAVTGLWLTKLWQHYLQLFHF